MQNTRSPMSVLVLILLSMVLTSTATAGRWQVVYDLADSGTVTTNPGGVFNDPIWGTITVEYDATSSVAPLSAGRLVAGTIDGTINQAAGLLTVTGANSNELLPGDGGTPGALVGSQLQLGIVADHNVTGSLHCSDATGGTLGFCAQFFVGTPTGIPASTPMPQTSLPDSHGPFTLPPLTFPGGTAGVGDFIGGPTTATPIGGVKIVTTYVGQEISRTWIQSDVPVTDTIGIVALLGGLMVSGLVIARRLIA